MTFGVAIGHVSQNYSPGARRGKHLFTCMFFSLWWSLHFWFAYAWTLKWSPWAPHWSPRTGSKNNTKVSSGQSPFWWHLSEGVKAWSAGPCGVRDMIKRICSGIWEVHFKGLKMPSFYSSFHCSDGETHVTHRKKTYNFRITGTLSLT